MTDFNKVIIESASSGTLEEFKNSLYRRCYWYNSDYFSEPTLEDVLQILKNRNTEESKLIQGFLADLIIHMDGYWDYPGLLYWQGVDDTRSNYESRVEDAYSHYRGAF